jgi:hypothetical protein
VHRTCVRPRIAALLVTRTAIAIVVIAFATSVVRGPEFHRYADARTWLGIPHAGDVLSNLAFVIVAALYLPRNAYAWAVRAGVAAIGVGSAVYHLSPGDLLLAGDWGPIAITLALLSAAVIDDRLGRRAGRIALVIGPVLAVGSVAWWLASGGTAGGNMAPYVAVQAAGIALPPLVALVAPGRIPVRLLLLGVLCFALARIAAAYDRALLEAIGISGHSVKHLVAALAAACALRALGTSRR